MVNYDALQSAATIILSLAGVDTQDPNFESTPTRWANMMLELTQPQPFDFTTFPNSKSVDQLIFVGPIHFYTLCAHHVIPFFGCAYIGYIPQDRLVGLSKLPRLVKQCATGLWMQEELGDRILYRLVEELDPLGAAVTLEARHLCMEMRGIQSVGTKTITQSLHGVVLNETSARNEYEHKITAVRIEP